MVAILARNNALEHNPPDGDQRLSDNGSSWLYTVTSLFGFATVRHPILSHRPLSDPSLPY
jgi:bacteriorhodopsin